jgi:serine protease Do
MKTKFHLRILLILFAILFIGGSTYYFAQENPAPTQSIQKPAATSSLNAARQMSQAFIEVSKRVTPSIVMIMNEEKLSNAFGNDDFGDFFNNDFFNQFFNFTPEQRERVQKTLGSGVIISSDGYIITNNHVIDNSTKLQVTLPDGKRVSGSIIGSDPKTDLALIKVDSKKLQPISFGNYQDIQVGECVLAIGSPFGEAFQRTVTAGIISAKGRSNVGITDYEDFLQTDAAINPGNSGGALVDLDGNLVGINTAIVSSTGSNAGVGFAIPVNIVQNVVQQLKQNGRVIRGFLGVTIQNLSPEMSRSLHLENVEGAVISDVGKGTPAEKAGLKAYDVITSINGSTVQNDTEVRNLIAGLKPGSRVVLGILRDGKQKSVSVAVGEMQAQTVAENDQKDGQKEKLGLELQDLTPALARELKSDLSSGAVIINVVPGSAAEDAGLQRGDIIFEINREPVKTAADVEKIVSKSDSTLLLAIERRGNSFFVTVESP